MMKIEIGRIVKIKTHTGSFTGKICTKQKYYLKSSQKYVLIISTYCFEKGLFKKIRKVSHTLYDCYINKATEREIVKFTELEEMYNAQEIAEKL